jgi:hypothetical protein
MTQRISRVFPRRTKATPDDELAYVGSPNLFAEGDEVHISVTFTWDKASAERLAEEWRFVAPVKIGGVPHVEAVFAMLREQTRRVEFTGGLEALSLQDYQVDLLAELKPRPTLFWAYDPGDEFETLQSAAKRMLEAGFTRESHRLRVYVLIGMPKDTFGAAECRLHQMLSIGFTPMAMLWRPERPAEMKYAPGPEWRAFQRRWVRPALIYRHQRHGEVEMQL